MNYELFCNSVRGASHIRKGTPCEDFGIKLDCGGIKIFAVADGHGDSNCLRSNIGSRYVCEIAAEELQTFALTLAEQGWEDRLFDKAEARQLVDRLVISIVGKWANAVCDELDRNPLTEEEIKKAPVLAREYVKGIRTERMYGTTLIAGLQTKKYLLLLQQGDGRCVVFDCSGNVSQPIPWDDRCFGTATTSLCDGDAAQSCRYHIIDLAENPVIACVAGTDGVEDSFPTSMEKTHTFYRDLLRYACENGVPALETLLADQLNELSENGSADDVTVSGIVDVERVRPFLEAFAEKNRIVELEDEVTILSSKVKSIEEGGKFRYLEKKYTEATAAFEKAESVFRCLAEDCDALAETIAAHEQAASDGEDESDLMAEIAKKLVLPKDALALVKEDYLQKCREKDAAEEDLRLAAEKKTAAEKDYLPYKERYENFVRQRDEAIERLNARRG